MQSVLVFPTSATYNIPVVRMQAHLVLACSRASWRNSLFLKTGRLPKHVLTVSSKHKHLRLRSFKCCCTDVSKFRLLLEPSTSLSIITSTLNFNVTFLIALPERTYGWPNFAIPEQFVRITNVKHLSWENTEMLFHIPVSASRSIRSIYRSLDCRSCSVSNKIARRWCKGCDVTAKEVNGKGHGHTLIKTGNTANNLNSKAGKVTSVRFTQCFISESLTGYEWNLVFYNLTTLSLSVTWRTTKFNIQQIYKVLTFAFVCFVWIPTQTATYALYGINRLGFYNWRGQCLLRGRHWDITLFKRVNFSS